MRALNSRTGRGQLRRLVSALRCAAVSCAAASLALSAHAQQEPAADTAPSAPTEPAPEPPQAPTPAPEAPVGEAGPEGQQAPEEKRGTVVVLFFTAEGLPLPAGAVVRLDDGTTATTTSDGTARLQTSAGPHAIELVTQSDNGAEQSVRVAEVVVLAGQSVQVLVNLDSSGGIASADIEGGGAPVSEAEVGAAPVEEEVVVEYGQISGTVRSSETGSVVEGARVLVRGVEDEVVTDRTGHFSIKAPVGTQSVSVLHVKYSLQTINDIVVEKDAATEVVVELTPTATQLDDFVVTAPYIQGGVASVMSERKTSSTVQDALGGEDIAKSPDGSASAATRRIVGASIVGGQFLFVRGLGGRYSNVRLNGVPMPSTDPDLPGFQLDLFPTSLLSTLTIAKTFSPDIPGDFAGGSLNVETRSFPEEFTFKVSVSGSIDTETLGSDVLDYSGGSKDWLGYDDGTRAMPDSIPADRIQGRSRTSPEGYTPEEIDEIGRGFPNHWALRDSTGRPSLGFGISAGDTLETSAGDVGYFLTLGYKNKMSRSVEHFTSVNFVGSGDERRLVESQTLQREVGSFQTQIGTLGTVSYAPVEQHRFSVVALLTQNGDDSAQLITGRSDTEGAPIRATSLRYIERQLLFNQLLGHHRDLGDVFDIDWQVNTARILRDQPDTRSVLYAEEANGFSFRGTTGSGEHLYTLLEQADLGGGLDLKLKFLETGAVKGGYMGRVSERSFSARRFGVSRLTGAPAEENLRPPEEFFDSSQSGVVWRVSEVTRDDDGYEAGQEAHAGYAMAEVPFSSAWRLMSGLRLESFHQNIQAVTPYRLPPEDVNEELPSGSRTDLDYLPAASLIVAITEDMNARLAYGGTVARPQIRELSPFINQDFARRRYVKGNPDLGRTYIHNFDVRWEMFPTPTEVFAVSVFYKLMIDPIESVILDQTGNISYENIDGAKNFGAEFEARVGLGLLSETLDDFSAMANLALIQSEVQLSPEQRRTATTDRRPLAGQSPYVANLALGYEPEKSPFSAFLYYNVFGRRIQDVGLQGLPDVYQEPLHSLDFTAFFRPDEHWTFGVSASNLLLQEERVTQGGLNYSRSALGVNIGANAAWSY